MLRKSNVPKISKGLDSRIMFFGSLAFVEICIMKYKRHCMWLIYHCHFFHNWKRLVWTFLFSGADSFSRVGACIIQAQCSILTKLHLISGPGLDSSVVYEVELLCTDHILISNTKQRGQQGYRKCI